MTDWWKSRNGRLAQLALIRVTTILIRSFRMCDNCQQLLRFSLVVGEILVSQMLLMMVSAAVVLSTLFLSAAVTSAKIARKLQTKT